MNKNGGRRKTKLICEVMKAKGLTLGEAFEEIDLHKRVNDFKFKNINDEEMLKLQLDYFSIIDKVAEKTALGYYKSFLLTGSGGVGKSYGIKEVFKKLGMDFHNCEAGELSPTNLYIKLYENRYLGNVLVFDDADAIFYNKTSLGFLKKALDSGADKRMLGYVGKTLKTSEGEIVPSKFEYKGSIIFISNINIYVKSKKENEIATHLQAIMSRSRYIDLFEIFNTSKDYLIRINYIKDTILDNRKIDLVGKKVINTFIDDNYAKFRELGIRTIDLLCETWLTCDRNEEYFIKEALTTLTSFK